MRRGSPVNRRPWALCAAALALSASLGAAPVSAQKKAKVFGFYPDFDLTPMLANAQLNLLTHVIYFSIRMPVDGNVTDSYVISQINGQKLLDLVDRGRDRGVKVLLGVGGWDLSNEFAGVAGSDARRKAFAASALKFCQANGVAGMDIDWEFPSGHQANYALLMDELYKAFKPAGLMVTQSVNGQAPQYYGSAALNKCDYVLIMSYDNGAPHSTYDQAVQAMNGYAAQVTDKAKLILGVPFYGKAGGATRTYAELLKQNPGMAASVNDIGGYNFNGPDLIDRKAGYALDAGGSGTMIWQVSQDALTAQAPGGVLLAAMNKGFAAKGASLDKPAVGIVPRDPSPRAGARSGRAGTRYSLRILPLSAYPAGPGPLPAGTRDALGRVPSLSRASAAGAYILPLPIEQGQAAEAAR